MLLQDIESVVATVPPAEQADVRRTLEQGARLVVGKLIESAVLEGKLDPKGKSAEQFGDASYEFLERELKRLSRMRPGDVEFRVTIDHTANLLRVAREFRRKGESELSCIFYATWMEHWLNNVLLHAAVRRGLTSEEARQLLHIGFAAKVGWALPLVGLRRIAESHRRAAIELSESRNRYVHYKWHGREWDARRDEMLDRSLQTVEKTVSYLKRYEREVIFGGHKAAIDRLTRGR